MPKFGTKNALFGYCWDRILKNYCHIWNQHPQVCLTAKFCEKTKMPKFGTKNALFGYFWDRKLKNYCHIWNQHCQKWFFVEGPLFLKVLGLLFLKVRVRLWVRFIKYASLDSAALIFWVIPVELSCILASKSMFDSKQKSKND